MSYSGTLLGLAAPAKKERVAKPASDATLAGSNPRSDTSGSTLAGAATFSSEMSSLTPSHLLMRLILNKLNTGETKELEKHGLPQTGFVRLSSIIAPCGPIPVGRSTWWAGVKTGRFPQPVKLGPRTTAWKVADIRDLIEKAS
jgi:prophage regulatory protein